LPADLASVVDAWAESPTHIRAAVLALIDSHGERRLSARRVPFCSGKFSGTD
jgi:hypothetical protein